MPEKRTIRSFVRRTGRMTPGQEKALREFWPVYGCDSLNTTLDLDQLYGRSASRVVEIGFGNGETLVQQATRNPQQDYLGIEVHEPGVGHCLLLADSAGITNLRVIVHDALEVLGNQIPDSALSRINLYFPDPWPKKRHHKRRILQPSFLQLAASKLQDTGSLHIATDWANYAEHIDDLVAGCGEFHIAERRVHLGDNALDRPRTKFESRGLQKGHTITDWRLQKN